MAKEYSHVKFTGCNFVPTRHPHSSNIQLEVYNLHDGFHGKDETYDLIHMLSTFKFVCPLGFSATLIRSLICDP